MYTLCKTYLYHHPPLWLGVLEKNFYLKHHHPPPSEVVAALCQEEPSFEIESPPRTKGDIIGYSEDSESDESIDINPKVTFLPATVEGLRKRFHELYTEFTRQGKHEHRNERAFLLDELAV